jgi:hypothetical protein
MQIFTLETCYLGHPNSVDYATCPKIETIYIPKAGNPFVVRTSRFPGKIDADRRFYLLSDAVAYVSSLRQNVN